MYIGGCDDLSARMLTMIGFPGAYGYGWFDDARPIGPALWPHFDLLWIHTGRVRLRLLDRENVDLVAGEGVLIYPHTRFAGRSLGAASRASVQHFDVKPGGEARLAPFRRLVGLRGGFERLRARHLGEAEAEIERAIIWASPPAPASEALRIAQLLIVLEQLQPASAAEPSAAEGHRFERLVSWLPGRVADPPSLGEMAGRCGMSVSHFRARFRRHFGVPPGEYVTGLRMREAARLLRESDVTIKEVARRVAYADLTHFYRAFGAAVGHTPGEYRRRHTPRG